MNIERTDEDRPPWKKGLKLLHSLFVRLIAQPNLQPPLTPPQ